MRSSKRLATSRAPKRVRSTALRAPGTDTPPKNGAPPATPPIRTAPDQNAVAPWPGVDRYPLVQGQSLTVSYLSSCFRLATTGYRMQYVDVLDELLEQDPHLFSVLQKRILSTANGRLEVVPAELRADHPDKGLAKEVADLVRKQIARIPELSKQLAALLWALYYGISAAEIFWTHDNDGWHVERLEFVHSRRLAYPDAQSWSLYVWDQGQVYGWTSPWGSQPTNSGVFGTRVADWPGKFIIFVPQLRGDYPTRDGLGRQLATWAIFKRIGARGAVEYLERFAKGFMDVEYSTANEDTKGKPREATGEDIALAKKIAASIGPGSGSYGAHPDSVKINPKSFDGGSATKLGWPDWLTFCNGEESKCVLGSTLGTEVSTTGGSRALGEVQERAELDLEQYDAACLGEALKRDLATWIVRLNKPEALHLVPRILIHVDKDPDPKALTEVIAGLVDMGAPVDADWAAEEVGLKLVPNTEKRSDGRPKPRRLFKSDVVDPTRVDPSMAQGRAPSTTKGAPLRTGETPPRSPPALVANSASSTSGARVIRHASAKEAA